MALITCKNCGNTISDKADICPNCSIKINQNSDAADKQPVAYNKNKNAAFIVGILFAIIGLFLFMISITKSTSEEGGSISIGIIFLGIICIITSVILVYSKFRKVR